MTIGIFAPSYRRPEKSVTQKNYPFVQLVVMESEAEEYRASGNEIVVCPDKAQGNLCRVRNWILDTYLEQYDCVVILDDDISYIGRWSERIKKKFEPEELLEFCEAHAILCEDAGLKFWGINCVSDKGAYMEYTPFGFLQYIGGPFQAHMAGSQIRYDESLPLKEDYDMSLQHMQQTGGCLRINYAFYEAKQSEQTGGCSTYRNLDREKQQFILLQKKWGENVITLDKKSRKSYDYNPILKVPLKGV